MRRTRIALTTLAVALALTLALWPAPARADGGPAVDPSLFPRLKEGQQVAVVTVKDIDTVSVDLFVSILDQTGESHEITYFVPLGTRPSGFTAFEEDSLSLARALTNDLDAALAVEYGKNRDFVQYLFGAALLTNGAWLAPLWVPLLLTGCGQGAAPEPLSTFTTPSSQVSVFAIDENTDLAELASTTGLAQSVTDTLARLKGQQIAVVKMRTTPRSGGGTGAAGSSGEPGLHLTWDTALLSGKSGATYAYPLGTGAAWANPIDMTRVYVVAPEGFTFSVKYPRLGTNRSGYDRREGRYVPRITDDEETVAYAVAASRGTIEVGSIRYYGGGVVNPRRLQVWRATYLDSNSPDDILVTVREGSGLTAFGQRLRAAGSLNAFLAGYIAAAWLWLLAWWLLMPRLVGGGTRFLDVAGFPIRYLGLSLLMIIPGTVFYWVGSFGGALVAGLIVSIVAFAAFGVLFFFVFLSGRGSRLSFLGGSLGLALRNLAIVTAASGGAYFLFALGYAWLVGAL